MTVTVSAVRAARPERLTAAAAELGAPIARLDALLTAERQALAALRRSWTGGAAEAAVARGEAEVDRQEELRTRLVALRRALDAGGGRLDHARAALLWVVGVVEATGYRVRDDGTVVPPPVPALLVVPAAAWTAVVRTLLALFTALDAEAAAAVHAAVAGPLPLNPPGTLGDPRRLPPPHTSAEQVRRWWDSLSRAEQQGLVAAHPPELGARNGIPAAVRDRVNRAVLHDDLARVRIAADRAGVTVDAVLGRPGAYGLTAADVARFRGARHTENDLNWLRDNGSGPGAPVLLWRYDPVAFRGQGRIAVAVGDPDTARHTAVLVPGTGSGLGRDWLQRSGVAAVSGQMQARLPGEATSVIAWLGYDAPDSMADKRVTTPWLARLGAPLLAADVNGLEATHAGGPRHVTVIGHSYGSTTVADAFAVAGMRADDAVLLGSPGTDRAGSAADFHLPEHGRVYVGAASSDPISWIGQTGLLPDVLNHLLNYPVGPEAGLGRDPAGAGYGAVRFDAEVPGRTLPDKDHHSAYFDLGSESLRAIADIATGAGADLAERGHTAEGRRQVHIGLPDRIELPWLGEIDLPDWRVRVPGTPAVVDPEGRRTDVHGGHQY